MGTRTAPQRPRLIAESGMVKGGKLNGWRYHLLHFGAGVGELVLLARCTPPNWPFPRDIWLDHTHFGTLRPIVGDRAKRLEVTRLVRQAFELEKLVPPPFIDDERMTLRAMVKRANQSIRMRPRRH